MNTDNQDNNIDNNVNNNVSNSINNTNLNKIQGNMTDGVSLPNEGTNNQNIDMQGVENNTTISEPNIQNQPLIQEQVQVSSNVESVPVQNEIQSVTPMETNTQMNTNISGMSNATIGNSQKNNKNLILIIIIILAVIIIGVVVLVMFLPKKNKVTSTNEYRGEPKTVYFYKVTSGSLSEYYQVYDKEQNSNGETTYELVNKYDCKTSCPTKAGYEVATFAVYDDGKFYEYDMAKDKMIEQDVDSELSFNGYKFKIFGNYVVTIGKNYSEMGYNGVEYFEILNVDDDEEIDFQNKEYDTIDIMADLDSVKDGMYALNDKGTITIYHENKAIDSFGSGGAYDGGFYKKDEFYVFSRIDEFDVYTKETKLPTLAYDIDGQCSIKDGKAMFINDNRLLIYDTSAKETKYEVDVAYAVVERYAIVIKDNKLEIYDAVDDKVVHSFNIDSNLKFLNGVTPDFYYENEDGEHIIQVFLQDTSKEIDSETGRIYGKSFEYDFNTNEESVEDDYTIAYNE